MAANPDPYSFSDLLTMGRSELRGELAETVSALCTAIEHVAFLKATSGKSAETIEAEGHRDALNEQKWLIQHLMDTLDG